MHGNAWEPMTYLRRACEESIHDEGVNNLRRMITIITIFAALTKARQ